MSLQHIPPIYCFSCPLLFYSANAVTRRRRIAINFKRLGRSALKFASQWGHERRSDFDAAHLHPDLGRGITILAVSDCDYERERGVDGNIS
jgi:hypothetical protein